MLISDILLVRLNLNSKWGNFIKVIDKAKKSCENSNNTIFEHFADVGKTIKMPKNAEKTIEDMN